MQKAGSIVFFPFDIFDQCSGFIAVKKITEIGTCNLFYIDSYIEGSTFNPWKFSLKNINWSDVIK